MTDDQLPIDESNTKLSSPVTVSAPLFLSLLVWVLSISMEAMALLWQMLNPHGVGLPRNGHLLLIGMALLSWGLKRRIGKDQFRQLRSEGRRFALTGWQMILVTVLVVSLGAFVGLTIMPP